MGSGQTGKLNELLQQGIAAARAGDGAKARDLLREAIKIDVRNETAWLWLSSVAENNKDRLFCLRQVLAINPQNDHAIKAMQKFSSMGATSATPGATSPESAPSSRQASSVPIIDPRQVGQFSTQLDDILARHVALPSADLPFTWGRKRGGRVGDAAAARFRVTLFSIGAVITVGIVAVIAVVVSNLGPPNIVVATRIPSQTLPPTPSATLTPGIPPTESPTPRVTEPPTSTPNFPAGVAFDMTATPAYPALEGNRFLVEAQGLLAIGEYDRVLPTLEFERKGLELRRNDPDSVYYRIVYYMVVAEVSAGRPGRALALLRDNQNADSAFYHLALATAYYAQDNLDGALTSAREASSRDRRLVQASVIAARVYARQGEFGRAESELADALGQQPRNAQVLIERGNVRLLWQRLDQALNDVQLALYIDPTNREGFILRNRVLTAQAAQIPDQEARVAGFGRAVLAAQEFLYYYPGDTAGWHALAQARAGEGNLTAALDAYAQAVVADETSEAAREVYLARGRLYLGERNFALARADFERALAIRDTEDVRRLALSAMLGAGDNVDALEQVNSLLRAAPTDAELLVQKLDLLIRARVRDEVGSASFGEEMNRASDAWLQALTPAGQAIGHTYRGLVFFEGGQADPALAEFNAALIAGDSPVARFYRGQIHESQERLDLALLDYDWLLYWGDFNTAPFMGSVRERADSLRSRIPTQTATVSPTHTSTRTATSTRTPSLTPTRTFTPSRTPSPTRTPTITRTPSPTRTVRPSATPRPTRTVRPTATPR